MAPVTPTSEEALALENRKVVVLEKEQETGEERLAFDKKQSEKSQWQSPLVVAVAVAAVAGIANGLIAIANGYLARNIETQKAEQARILEAIKTGDPDSAATNLEFLVKSGLISNTDTKKSIQRYLDNRAEGSGPSLPALSSQLGSPGIVGKDEARPIETVNNPALQKLGQSVGQIFSFSTGQATCTAFLVSKDYAITGNFCFDKGVPGSIVFGRGESKKSYEIDFANSEIEDQKEGSFAVLKLEGEPGRHHGFLPISSVPPKVGSALNFILFRADQSQLGITGSPDCVVRKVTTEELHHLCDTGGGSSGSPLFSRQTNKLLGMHIRSGLADKVGLRIDYIISKSPIMKIITK